MAIADELQKLEELHRSGALSDDEYGKAKAAVLSGSPQAAPCVTTAVPAVSIETKTREWATFLHLSLLAGFFLIPLAGLIIPILIWLLKKDELPGLDAHGKVVVNWMISLVIYTIVSCLLILVIIGIPLLLVIVVLAAVFPIIGAVKANEGVVWEYPLSIKFLS